MPACQQMHGLREATAAVLCLALSGCLFTQPGSFAVDDPPWLSPYARPLNAGPMPQRVQAGRMGTMPFPGRPVPIPGNGPNLGEATTVPPGGGPLPQPGPGMGGSSLLPESSPTDRGSLRFPDRPDAPSTIPEPGPGLPERKSPAAPATPKEGPAQPELRVPSSSIEMKVRAPRTGKIGEPVLFEVELRNASSAPVENIRVECVFDDALVFSQKPDKRVARTFDRLAAGEVREVRLSLVPREAGRHCCRFTIEEGGVERAWRSACVEVGGRAAGVSLVAPKLRFVGTRAEVTVKAVNLGREPLENVRLVVRSEAALKAYDWSQGGKREDGAIRWDLGTLPPSEGAQVQIEFDCLQPSEESCVTAAVELPGGKDAESTACLAIQPRGDAVRLELADDRDPIAAGDETTYQLAAQNVGLQPLANIQVELAFPAQVEVRGVEATVAGRPVELAEKRGKGTLQVSLPQALPVDAKLVVKWTVRALEPGDATVVARVSAEGLEAPLDIDEPTTINPPAR